MGTSTKLEVGEGRTRVHLTANQFGDGYIVSVEGEGKHIGAVALATPHVSFKKKPSSSASIISRETHKDGELVSLVSQVLSKHLKVPVAVIGGIHIDEATMKEIDTILSNARTASEQLAQKLS